MATFTVVSTADNPSDTGIGIFGAGTLRQGFNYLSANEGGTISFDSSSVGNTPAFTSTAALKLANGLTYTLNAASAQSVTVADVFTGDGLLTKWGAGTLRLTGASTANTIVVDGGTLVMDAGGSFRNVIVHAGAIFEMSGSGSLSHLTIDGSSTNTAAAFLAGSGTSIRGGHGHWFHWSRGHQSEQRDSGPCRSINRNTLGFERTYNLSGGTLTSGDVRVASSGVGTFNQSGGTFTGSIAFYVGYATGNGTYTMSGGVLTTPRTQVSDFTNSSIFTQTGGTHTTNVLALSAYNSGSSGTYTLGGGAGSTAVLAIKQVTAGDPVRGSGVGTSTFHFDGGTLQPRESSTMFLVGLTKADVLAGGARIDTAGFDVTIAQALVSGAQFGRDSGLTKLGAGTLTLTGANSYTGVTTVSAGTLAIDGTVISDIAVAAGGALRGTGSAPFSVYGGSVSVQAGGTFAPGSAAGLGTFTSQGLSVAGTFAETIAGASTFGQARSTSVALSGALAINYAGSSPSFSVGMIVKIIDNTGSSAVSGVFYNAAEGAVLGSTATASRSAITAATEMM